jgi:hypothetical protein
VAYSALEIALYGYAAANPRVVRGFHAQDTHGGGRGNRCLSQSFDWADAASCSRRTLLTMGYTAGNLDGVSASGMVEICRGSWEYAVEIRILAQDVRQLRYIFNQQRTIVQDRQSMRDVSATFAVTVTSPSPSPLL